MKILVVNSYSNIINKVSSEISSNVENLTMLTSLYKKKGSILYFLSSFFSLIDNKTKNHLNYGIDPDRIVVKGEFLRILNRAIHKFKFLKFLHRLNEITIDILLVREAKRLLSKNAFDILIVYDPTLLPPIIEKNNLIKSVFMMTGAAPQYVLEKLIKEENKFPNYRLYREFSFIEKYIQKYNDAIPKFDLVVAPSKYAMDSLPCQPAKGKILNFGFEINNHGLKWLQRNDGELRIVFVGRATLLKGFHYLVDIAKSMTDYKVRFFFIGDITTNIIKENYIPDNISILGRKKHSEVLRILSDCDVLLHPTLSEGQSLAIMEALSLGLTIITTEASGYSQILGKNCGYIFNEIKINTIKDLLVSILKEKKMLTEESHKSIMVSKNLTWNNYGEKLTSYMNEILEKS